ncbi:MAG: SUMF1/EgtB/PvdO family nonheme iron enzyme [Nitrospira sp.]|nr:SUMF1/EgtB/PvdO family nonheme iron enzyme [Nitrospira sp.]
MSWGKIRRFVLVVISILIVTGTIAHSEELMPLDTVPAAYAKKKMPAGWWTDSKVIKEGRDIYFGEAIPLVACSSCHGQDGQPVSSGGGLRDQNNVSRFSDSYWYWRVAEGIPKTPMMPWKSLLSEDQIWKVIAFIHTFSHKGKPSQHTDYKAESRPKKVVVKDPAPMILVPAGEFTMGSDDGNDDEKPAHRISLDAYYIDQHEVTVGQYGEFLEANSFDPPPTWTTMAQPTNENRPVVNVDWKDANNYCRWAGKRLPTEAEWEKAARGTDGRTYPWGNDPPNQLRANYGKDKWDNHSALVPVGQLKDGQSPYGIHDLAGNAWEWVSDWYDPEYYTSSPSRNPKGPDNGKYKVLRGGSWDLAAENLRSSRRDFNISSTTDYDSPAYRNFNSGFRCAKSP